LNVLYISQYFSEEPTHASTVTTYELVTRLAKRKHSVTVVSADSPGIRRTYRADSKTPEVARPLPVPFFTSQWYDGITTLFTHTVAHVPLTTNVLLARRNRSETKFDVIISMYHPTHLATVSAQLLSRVLKLPLVVKIYDFIIETIEPQKLKRMYHLALGQINTHVLKRSNSVVLVQSPELREIVRETCSIDDERLVLFPNGVDTNVFKPEINSSGLREKLGFLNKTVVLFLGGLYRQRHPELLVDALPKVIDKAKEVQLLFVGEGPEKPNLVSLANRLGVREQVRFLNSIGHGLVPELISLADVTIGPLSVSPRPTIYGSTPLTVLEYMACGKPVVVSDGAVSKSLISDEHTGVVVPPNDIHGLSSAIIRLIEDKRFSNRVARNARKHVERTCSWDVLLDKLEAVLRLSAGPN